MQSLTVNHTPKLETNPWKKTEFYKFNAVCLTGASILRSLAFTGLWLLFMGEKSAGVYVWQSNINGGKDSFKILIMFPFLYFNFNKSWAIYKSSQNKES